MGNLLGYDNQLMRKLNKIADTVLMGLLWLICCLPMVTVGAASGAFYYAYQKSIRQGKGYPFKEFFRGFKANFQQATKVWLFMLVLLVVLAVDIMILTGGVLEIGLAGPFLLVTSLVISLLLMMWCLCIFPYMARFENDFKVLVKNSAIVTAANLLWAALLLAVFIAAVLLFFTAPIISLVVPAGYMYVANLILERVFRKYMRPEDLAAQKEEE